MARAADIVQTGDAGLRVFALGVNEARLFPLAGAWALGFWKGGVELEALGVTGLDEAAALERATRWLLEEQAAANAFDARRSDRISGRRARADRIATEGRAAFEQGATFLAAVPVGQPVHPTAGGRRFGRQMARARGQMRRGSVLIEEATALQRRAAASDANTAISSDDPDAIAELRGRLDTLRGVHEKLSRIRKATRRPRQVEDIAGESAALRDRALGLTSDEVIHFALNPVEDFTLRNSSARIRSVAQRLAELVARVGAPVAAPETIGGVVIREEDNRVRIVLPRRAAKAFVREVLRPAGFVWSPSAEAWQRKAGAAAWQRAREVAAAWEREGTT